LDQARVESDDVRRAAAGDPGAFRRLYDEHVGRIHALALRMTDAGLAEDMTQEVFIRAWERLSSFRGEARFGTWLHRLAVNHILTARARHRRRQNRHVSAVGALERAEAPPRRSSGVAMDLEAAVATLPEGAKQVFVLYDVEGYKHDEIAELMGISVGTSKSQLHRARMLLREQLN
jgi:RNA polymerase sigma-70 factor (ECF subfamily)